MRISTVALAVAAERERCAKIADAEKKACENSAKGGNENNDLVIGQVGAASRIAAAIRSQ